MPYPTSRQSFTSAGGQKRGSKTLSHQEPPRVGHPTERELRTPRV